MVAFQTVNDRCRVISYKLLTISTGDDIVPGNNGMLDQVEAMKWVQKNIKGKTVLIIRHACPCLLVSMLLTYNLSSFLFNVKNGF